MTSPVIATLGLHQAQQAEREQAGGEADEHRTDEPEADPLARGLERVDGLLQRVLLDHLHGLVELVAGARATARLVRAATTAR